MCPSFAFCGDFFLYQLAFEILAYAFIVLIHNSYVAFFNFGGECRNTKIEQSNFFKFFIIFFLIYLCFSAGGAIFIEYLLSIKDEM